MALSLLNSQLYSNMADGVVPAAYYPLTQYVWDASWGPAVGDTPAVFAVSLSAAGATINTGVFPPTHGHLTLGANRVLFDAGYFPDSLNIWLSKYDQAAGYWTVTFPSAGSYTLGLNGATGSQIITVASALAAPSYPTYSIAKSQPLQGESGQLLNISWNGAYPAGGFDFPSGFAGLNIIQWAGINDTALYRFYWQSNKLRVYSAAGTEVSGAINFTTTGLFIGG